MRIYLRDFVIKIAKEKDVKLHDHTKLALRSIERDMERNKEIAVEDVMSELKNENDLRIFGKDEWSAIEKEVRKMI